MTDLGWAQLYAQDAPKEKPDGPLEDVAGSDWRNILVLGRATATGVYPETLALVGRARHLADELGCRVEVLLMGDNLAAATEELRKYPIHTVYRVHAPEYAPIDHTAKILQEVVRKRRPEMVLVFQSRTGDAVAAYTANRFGVGFVLGASRLELDTAQRRLVVTHESGLHRFQVVTRMEFLPQVLSVQRGLFRAPMQDPDAQVRVHDLDVQVGNLAAIVVRGRKAPPPPTLANAERVVVAGARIQNGDELQLARDLARRLGAVFGVTTGIVERGLAPDETNIVGVHDTHIRPRLLVTVGVRGALDLLAAVKGAPTICAIGCDAEDPIAQRAAYMVPGDVATTTRDVLAALA